MTNCQTAEDLPFAALELVTKRAEDLPFAASDKSLELENAPENHYALHLSGVSPLDERSRDAGFASRAHGFVLWSWEGCAKDDVGEGDADGACGCGKSV